jgi:uncharacterized RDD family membrane protein YckC
MSCPNHDDVEEGLRRCTRCGGDYCGDCTIVFGGSVICANCKDEALRDHLSGVGTTLTELASIPRRFAAWLLDLALYVVLYAAALLGGRSFFTVVFASVIFFIYEALMLAKRGQTLGKMRMDIHVVRADGTPLTARDAWLRAGIRAICVSVFALIDYLPALLTAERTCVHDLVAGTRVVRAGNAG